MLIRIVFKKYYDEEIEMICTNSLKHHYYLILSDIIVDYKEQILITRIKVNVQCFVCYISSQK